MKPLYSQVILNFQVNATSCMQNLIFNATAEIQRKDNQQKMFLYSWYLTATSILQIISTIRMLKSLFDSNVWAEHYSLISLAIASAQDAYIAMVHFYIALSIEVFYSIYI